MIYGATGTVNMVQLADRMTQLPQETQYVLHVMLLLAFAIKAAVFPVSFWLPDSYPTAPAPVTGRQRCSRYVIFTTSCRSFLPKMSAGSPVCVVSL